MSIQPPPPGSYPSAPPPGSYPSMAPAPWETPAVQGPPPSTVVNAFKLILVQAALGLVSVVVTLLTTGAIKDQLRTASPKLDQSTIDAAASVAIVVAVTFGIIGIIVWILLAMKVRSGKNWARIVIFVFAGIGVLSGLASVAQAGSALSHILMLVGVAIDIALVVLLTRGPSVEFFRRKP
jgi:cytochrome bd-type quinol oxidase subunit 2